MRDIIQLQAPPAVVLELQAAFEASLIPPDEDDEYSTAHDLPAWTYDSLPDSTENLAKLSSEELWSVIGLGGVRRLSTMPEWYDPLNVFNTFTAGSQAVWDAAVAKAAAGGSEDPFQLRRFDLAHYQLVAAIRMLQLAFDGKPPMLMDEVGLGKTVECVAFMHLLILFRSYYNARGCFPGSFGMSNCYDRFFGIHILQPIAIGLDLIPTAPDLVIPVASNRQTTLNKRCRKRTIRRGC
jgi:hypothetical protein